MTIPRCDCCNGVRGAGCLDYHPWEPREMTFAEYDLYHFFKDVPGAHNIIQWVNGWHQRECRAVRQEAMEEAATIVKSITVPHDTCEYECSLREAMIEAIQQRVKQMP